MNYEDHHMNKNVMCITCMGNRFILLGERDPIEGSKMQTRVRCPKCDGLGHVSTHTPIGKATDKFWEVYKAETKKEEEARKKERAETEKNRRSGLAKLTSEEKKALGL